MTRTWPALVALGALLISGCGAGSTDPAERADRERQRPGVERTGAPDEGRPERQRDGGQQAVERRIAASPSISPGSPPADPLFGHAGADEHLIGADSLGTRWSVSSTADEDGRLASACQQASLHDIGAQLARLRDYAAPRGEAVQAVAEFADRASARRADAVLLAWRDRCADRLRKRDAALGTVRHGAWVSLVEVAGVRSPARRLAGALDDVRATFG
jgi:hypothetical protein